VLSRDGTGEAVTYRKVYEVTGYVMGACAFCPEHKPDGDPTPIFLGDEWDAAPTCDVCHEPIEVTVIRGTDRE
jgi:hypothetical protein